MPTEPLAGFTRVLEPEDLYRTLYTLTARRARGFERVLRATEPTENIKPNISGLKILAAKEKEIHENKSNT